MSFESKMDKELRFHMEQAVEDYIAQGMTREDAQARARRDFGAVELAKDELRDTRALRWLTDLWQDVKYALRGFRRNPAFTVTAIAVLGLGIGANTTVFTLLHGVLLAPLPVPEPQELVELSCTNPLEPDDVECGASFYGYRLLTGRADLFRGAFAFDTDIGSLNVAHEGVGDIATGMVASGDFYKVLAVTPVAGRLLTPSDDKPGATPVVVLSHAYWQRKFAADAGVVGKTVQVNSLAVTIIGVTPAEFRNVTLDATPDLTFPLAMVDTIVAPGRLNARDDWWLRIIARKQADVSLDQIQAALSPVFAQTVEDMISALGADGGDTLRASLRKFRFVAAPAMTGAASEMRRDLDRPLRILMSAVTLVLLIACANLAGLILARSRTRQREFGVRLALGAGRVRIMRQLMAESVLLAGSGAAVGLALSALSGEILLGLAAGTNGLRAVDTSPNSAVLGFTAGISVAVAIIIGLLPALRLSVIHPLTAMRELRSSPGTVRWLRGLIPAQVGLTVVLLIGAVLFLRTFDNLRQLDLGYRVHELLQFRVSPGLVNYDGPTRLAYFQRLAASLETLPGVTSVTVSQRPVGNIGNRTAVMVPGFEPRDFNAQMVSRNWVGPRFVETTGLKLLHGRDMRPGDEAAPNKGVIVNESFATHFYGRTDVVGQRLPRGDETVTIVGVVADARERGPKMPPERTIYVPLDPQAPSAYVTLRMQRPTESLMSGVRSALAQVDRAVPVEEMQTASEFLEGRLNRERLLGTLSTAFAMLALLLVGVGVYGLISGAATARTRELGIRVALGAKPMSVVWLVIRDAVALVAAGAVAGLAAGLYVAQFVEAQLFEVKGTAPGVYLAAAVVLLGCAGLAAYLPARRAAGVDPVAALRVD